MFSGEEIEGALKLTLHRRTKANLELWKKHSNYKRQELLE
jgi:hypothetical protein